MLPKTLNDITKEVKEIKYVSSKSKPILTINTEEQKIIVTEIYVESKYEDEDYRIAGAVAVDIFELILGGFHLNHQYIEIFEGYCVEVHLRNQRDIIHIFDSVNDRYEYFDVGLRG